MANLSNINGKFVVEQTTGYVGVGTTDPNYPIEVLNASAEIALNASGGSIYRLRSTSADSFIITKNGVGDRLVIDGSGNSTFAGTVETTTLRTDVVNNKANSANIIYRSGTDTLVGGGGLTAKVYIQDGGNVGIGTDSPDCKLDIRKGGTTSAQGDTDLLVGDSTAASSTAQVQILGGATGYSNLYFSDTAAYNVGGFIYNHTSNYLAINVNATERMRIDSSGRTSIIGVFESPTSEGILNLKQSSGVGSLGMGFYDGGTNPHFWLQSRSYSNYSTTYNLALQPTGGNVGIGTTSPLASLSVGSGSFADTNVPVQISTSGGTSQSWFGVNKDGNYGLLMGYLNGGSIGDGGVGAYIRNITEDPLYFMVSNSDLAMTILANKNVGIGTNGPSKKLEVAGSYKLGTNAWIQYDAAYPYTISMLNSAGVGNLILNAGYGSSGFESKIELQGSNTAGGASITFTTASSQALVIKNGGDLTVSGSIIDANGVRTYRNGGSMNNGVAYTFDITVPNDSGSGTIHHVDAMMTHYDTTYGCLLNCYAYTRGTAVSTQTDLVNQTSTQGGGWFVTKPNSTTLRITKTAGTYVGTGFFQIVVITKST